MLFQKKLFLLFIPYSSTRKTQHKFSRYSIITEKIQEERKLTQYQQTQQACMQGV